MKNHLITNVVYGPVYLDIFCNIHLRSLLDETNLPAVKDRMHYIVNVDQDTEKSLQANDNFKRLSDTCKTEVHIFEWHDKEGNRFGARYSLLVEFFRQSIGQALSRDAYLSAIVADLYFAKGAIPKIHAKMDEGHDAVFMLPMRTSFDALRGPLTAKPGAMDAMEAFKFGFAALHPLWWACHWENPLFSKLPFSLLWSTKTGILARSFSITPLIFQPTVHMESAKQVIDVEIPSFFSNPFWSENWTDAPVMGVEPTVCYYPPFKNQSATTDEVGEWAQSTLHPTQFPFIEKCLYYPDKATAAIPKGMELKSDDVVRAISEFGGFLS